MHIGISSSLEETVEMVWRLRALWARVARLAKGPAGAETFDSMDETALAGRGLARREIASVVAENAARPPGRRLLTAGGVDPLADPFEGRMPFARRRLHVVVAESGRAGPRPGVPSRRPRVDDAA